MPDREADQVGISFCSRASLGWQGAGVKIRELILSNGFSILCFAQSDNLRLFI
jgi:hypothetical protein